jgi:hypothetical protein
VKATQLVGELIVLIAQHGDREVVDLDGCDPIISAVFSEDSEENMKPFAPSPFYLTVDR